MPKTCISVSAVGKAPEIVKGFIDKNGWPISTIITKPDSVSIYFYYKWYQYYNVCKVEQAVKRFEKLNKWHYKPNIYVYDFTKKKKRQHSQQSNTKNFSKNSAAQSSFKEILDAEMSKL